MLAAMEPRRSASGWQPRTVLGVGLLALAGGLCGYQLLPEPQAHASAPSALSVGGVPVDSRTPARAAALAASHAFLRAPVHVHVGERAFRATRHALGARVDLAHLTALIEQARQDDSALRRLHEQLSAGTPLQLPLPAHLEGPEARDWVLRVKDQVDRQRRDARVDPETGAVLAEQDGVALDVHGTLDALSQALFDGEDHVRAVVELRAARRTREQLESVDLSGLLGAFETRYSTLEKDEARAYNLHVAAEHVDGVVLMPGEELDFNEVVGERSEANGFRVATVIAAGELADGVGGGTCQIAGTLHAAAYFAGLEFLERHPHSRPSSYIKLGLDAVVSYPKLNLRIRNPFDHPIGIGVDVGRGRVQVQIRGPKRTRRMVSFVRRVDEVLPYEERVREDPSLPEGVRVLAQRGVPGFKLTTFRVLRDLQTRRARRERRQDTYPPTTQLWRLGTGDPPPEDYQPPEGDTHHEYRADEYLVMTFDPDSDELSESKRAGKTGTPGWTEALGMPQPKSPEEASE